MMQVTHKQNGAASIISIVGNLDALTAPQLTDYIGGRIGEGNVKLIVDLAQLDYTSSAGLRVLLSAVKETRSRNGDLRLAAVQPNVKKVLEMSGFTSILKIFDDVPTALASYS
jgi:anti-sigma B factor antagonist